MVSFLSVVSGGFAPHRWVVVPFFSGWWFRSSVGWIVSFLGEVGCFHFSVDWNSSIDMDWFRPHWVDWFHFWLVSFLGFCSSVGWMVSFLEKLGELIPLVGSLSLPEPTSRIGLFVRIITMRILFFFR